MILQPAESNVDHGLCNEGLRIGILSSAELMRNRWEEVVRGARTPLTKREKLERGGDTASGNHHIVGVAGGLDHLEGLVEDGIFSRSWKVSGAKEGVRGVLSYQ